MDERYYNQEPKQKEVQTTDCEYCDGDGWIYGSMDNEDDPASDPAYRMDCPNCEGKGYLEY